MPMLQALMPSFAQVSGVQPEKTDLDVHTSLDPWTSMVSTFGFVSNKGGGNTSGVTPQTFLK